MPYAIMRFQKVKMGGVSARGLHNERMKEAYKSNPGIDMSRNQDNYHIVAPKQTYRREVRRMIAEAGCTVLSNSTVMVETLITASPEFIQALPPDAQREYFSHAVAFMQDKVGEKNIVSAIVHMDEASPHMHLCFCPITQNGKLSAKAILGNQAQLSRWQTAYHAAMSARWPVLERGISAQITKRQHIPVWLFKTAERLDRQTARIEAAIADIGVFNAKKQSAKALKILSAWLPEATRFTAQVKTVDSHIDALEKAVREAEKKAREAARSADQRLNDVLTRVKVRFDDKENELQFAQREASELRRKLRNADTLINSIPLELRDRLLEQHRQRKERSRER